VPLHDVTAGMCWSVCATNIRPDILRPSVHTDVFAYLDAIF